MRSWLQRLTVRHWGLLGLAMLLAVAGLVWGLAFRHRAGGAGATLAGAPTPTGAQSCRECHAEAYAGWQGSHHQRAMQAATAATVLGDFTAARVEACGEWVEFVQRGDAFLMRTADASGAVVELRVTWVIGITPLQQYLVAGERGRLRSMPWCWDTRPAEAGGQRWFHLYDGAATPIHPDMRWHGVQQVANHMCIECHLTGYTKDYQAAGDRYDSHWAEVGVSCESCHGPGSHHVAWARQGEARDPASPHRAMPVAGLAGQVPFTDLGRGDGIARSPQARRNDPQIELCARCHSRRETLQDAPWPTTPYHEQYSLSPLQAGLYHADGQILDEVYEVGSFLQSRMYHAGVTCTDCHDPHRAALRVAPDASCARCHEPARFASPAHHHHAPDSAGASCVACHMPARTYMGVDDRRDHSFRIPRPDLTRTHGVPNACQACHADQSAAWLEEHFLTQYGPQTVPPYLQAHAAGLQAEATAPQRLAALVQDPTAPAIQRATLLPLATYLGVPEARVLAATAADSPSPLLRAAAARTGLLDPERLQRLARDPQGSVRLAVRRTQDLPGPVAGWDTFLAQYADRPEGRMLAGLSSREPHVREAAYREALQLVPTYVPALVNLADLRREQGREPEALELLQRAVALEPENALAWQALGLAHVRSRQYPPALEALRRAHAADATSEGIAFTYVVALYELGQAETAAAIYHDHLRRRPFSPRLLELRAVFE